MSDKKKLVGVYLPLSLIDRLKKYIFKTYIKDGTEKSQSEIVEEALEKHLDQKEKEVD